MDPCITEGIEVKITVSAGCISYKNSIIDSKLFYQEADSALYKAKESGRNKIICFSEK